MNEYELYIRSYGASNTAQVAVQTNEDLVEKGMQTEDWFIEDKWIQAPAENFVECDSEYPSLPWLEERKVPKKTSKKSDGRDQSKQEFERKMIKALSKVDSQRLSRFLNGASKVMEAILEENEIAAGFTGSFETKSSIKIGEAFTTLAKLPILEGRGLRCLEYSPVDSRMFLTAWTKSKSQQQHKSKGILCLWHLSDPKTPYRLLLLEGDPTSCCFSPARPHLAFAGTEDGSIQVWDLKEREVTRRDSAIDVGAGKAVRLQYPSYSTEGLYSTDTPTKRAHEESIVKILANNSAEQSSDAVDEYTVGNVTSQVASFDESGAVQFWTVLEFRDEAEAFKEAQNDLGMWVGGRVKLTNGKSLNIKNSEKSALSPIVTLSDVTLAPAEAGQFVAASDIGIIRESRYQDRCHPRQYLPSKVAQDDLFRALPAHLRVIDKPTTVAFSPFFPDIFAGCFYSGRVALFRLSSEVPIKTWVLESAQQGRTKQVSPPPVKCVRWSAHRPAVFFVLDQESGLHVWDLMESDRGPHYTMDLTLMGKAKATMFALSGNAAHTKGHPVESSSHECLMLGYENGVIEAHKLTTELVEPTIDEEQRFKEYLEKL
ncbi:WD40-repeat-containing domain protein [Cladochytrium replicatum]|nr:WD40-repeat-containing domain protein [Cladochytrium replicatum]